MRKVEYHIHVNHFEKNLPDCVGNLLSLGFNIKESSLIRNDIESPLWLIAKKVENSTERDELYKEVFSLVEGDKSFRGYIESETVSENNVIKYDPANGFKNCSLFPINKVKFQDCVKTADIHIYRDKTNNLDALDILLEDNGFYEVRTPDKKIWTLLIKDISSSQTLLNNLHAYFKNTGGILELELELIKELKIFPNSYSLPAFIKPVSFNLVGIKKRETVLN